MKDWIMVRITRRNHRRLKALLEITLEQREKGRVQIDDSDKPGGGPPTVNSIIQLLLDRDEKHRARARKQQNKKRGYTHDPVLPSQQNEDWPQADSVISLSPAGQAEVDQVAARDRDAGARRCHKCQRLIEQDDWIYGMMAGLVACECGEVLYARNG